MLDVVGGHAVGAIGSPVPAEVGGQRLIAGVRERTELVPPGEPQLRPAVEQHDERPLAALSDVKLDAVDLELPVHDVPCHGRSR